MDLAGDIIQSMTEFLGIEVCWTAIQCLLDCSTCTSPCLFCLSTAVAIPHVLYLACSTARTSKVLCFFIDSVYTDCVYNAVV